MNTNKSTTTTYTIFATELERVTKKLDRLVRKAVKSGTPFSYSVGQEHPQTLELTIEDPDSPYGLRIKKCTLPVVDITLNTETLIFSNGWELRARVEQGEKGRIVRGIGFKEVPASWYTDECRCDHCNAKRFRKISFYCEHENGEIKQVGKNCLRDFTGISPESAVIWSEVYNTITMPRHVGGKKWSELSLFQLVETELALAHSCDSIQKNGYRKTCELNCTREDVAAKLKSDSTPSQDGIKKAKLIMAWLIGLDPIVRNEQKAIHDAELKAKATRLFADEQRVLDLQRNQIGRLESHCIAFALSGFAKYQDLGVLSYMPIAYEKYTNAIAQRNYWAAKRQIWEAERLDAVKKSQHIGTIGQRISVNVVSARLLTSWETEYGILYMYQFKDNNGNVYIWKTGKEVDTDTNIVLKGTVKQHNTFREVKQTVLTRCAVLAA